MPPFDYDLVQLSYLDYLTDLEEDRQKAVALARRYYEGDHDVFLTDRMKEYLGVHDTADNKFRLNASRSVVTAVLEHLSVVGFDAAEPADADGTKPTAAWADGLWNANRMDALQHDVHEGAIRDGEHFVIVDWDALNIRPQFLPHPRFVSSAYECQDSGYGVRMIYPDDNIYLPPRYAVKEWVETIVGLGGYRSSRLRRTFYYPDRIERFVYSSSWQPFVEQDANGNDLPWPTPWANPAGEPLGIPVVHFRNRSLRPEAWDAIPIQDGTNKSFIDLLASADMTAFRIFAAIGFIPTTDGNAPAADGSNALKLAPGMVVGTTKPGSTFDAIDPADISQLGDLVEKLMLWMAMVTDTPAGRFNPTHQVASGETLKEQGKPLDAKVAVRQTLLGNSWEDCFNIARRLANAFGGMDLDETIQLTTQWQQTHELSELVVKRGLGVPDETLWSEAGYTQEQIAVMKETDEYQAKVNLMQSGLNAGGG